MATTAIPIDDDAVSIELGADDEIVVRIDEKAASVGETSWKAKALNSLLYDDDLLRTMFAMCFLWIILVPLSATSSAMFHLLDLYGRPAVVASIETYYRSGMRIAGVFVFVAVVTGLLRIAHVGITGGID